VARAHGEVVGRAHSLSGRDMGRKKGLIAVSQDGQAFSITNAVLKAKANAR
jgi:hypothetical protein